jgi:SulP family sulfate permease
MKPILAFPFLRWSMDRHTLRADLIAGLTVALLLIPQAMAYAQLMGVPPHYGLYAAAIPCVVAALFGWCHQLHTGPVAMTSLMTAAVIGSLGLAGVDSSQYVECAVLLAFLSGLILLLAGVCGLSLLVNLLSHPVVVGFTQAAALMIAASQIPLLLRLPMGHGDSFLVDLGVMMSRVGSTHGPTLAIGTFAVTLMVGMRRVFPRWPGVLIVVGVLTLMSGWVGFESRFGGHVVGVLPAGLPSLQIPHLSWGRVLQLMPGACMIALIGFMEVVSISKVISLQTGQRLNFDQELMGQGMGRLVGSFFQSVPVSGSFSRSALNLYAGARTGFASVVAGGLVVIVMLVLTPWLYHLPRAVLGAVILVAVWGLFDFRAFLRIARVNRRDGVVAAVTFLSTLFLAPRITTGILIGILLSVAFQIVRMMRPHVAILGRHPDGTLRDIRRHGLIPDPEILAIRFDGRLIFTNAVHFEESLLEARSEYSGRKAVLLVAEGINEIDSSGEAMLREMVRELQRQGIPFAVARLKWPVLEVLRKTGLDRLIGEHNIYPTADEALIDLRKRLAGGTDVNK